MVTLDELEQYTWHDQVKTSTTSQTINVTKISSVKKSKKTNWFKELGMFGVVMSVSALGGIIFTNLHLFQAAILEDVFNIKDQAPTVIASTDVSIISEPEIVETNTSNHFYLDTKDHLKNQLASNTLVFNTLPPDNRVIIDDLWVDAPIVDLNYYTPEKLEKWDFKTELERGVVRYPNTGTPEAGNMLIFGHTSDYWRNNNAFGQIFRNIPKLTEWQIVKIIWNNHMYRYKITTKKVVKPSDVAKTYAKYHDEHKNYITLVWCFPVGTASKRIVVIGEQLTWDVLPNESNKAVIQLAKYP